MDKLLARSLGAILSPQGGKGRLAAFCYHQVLEHKDPLRPDEPCQVEFKNEIETIENVFNILPVPEAAKRLANGTLPPRAACITFDDGYANNHDIAVPILQRAGVPATFFVAGGAIDVGIMWNDLVIETFARSAHPVVFDDDSGFTIRQTDEVPKAEAIQTVLVNLKYKPLEYRWDMVQKLYCSNVDGQLPRLMMTREMVSNLSRRGFNIGGHTINHPILEELPDDDAYAEIENSYNWVQSVTGRKPTLFAYPNGKPKTDFSERHQNMVANAGYRSAFTTEWDVGRSSTDEFCIPRIGPWWRAGRTLPMGLLRLYGSSYVR